METSKNRVTTIIVQTIIKSTPQVLLEPAGVQLDAAARMLVQLGKINLVHMGWTSAAIQ
jgi:hypothetical protein